MGLIPRVIGVAESANHMKALAAVAAYLPTELVYFSASPTAPGPVTSSWVPGAHATSPGWQAVLEARRAASRVAERGQIWLVPQDVGMLYRAVVAGARQRGAVIALLPDGAVSESPVSGQRRSNLCKATADRILASLGILAGQHGVMGGTVPDVVFSWGAGWDQVWRSRGISQIEVVGSPRADDLLDRLGTAPASHGGILIASQPLWSETMGGVRSAVDWYAWVERICAGAAGNEVLFRLHPAERDRVDKLMLGAATRERLSAVVSLEEDLARSSSVVSVGSTVLVEAARTGRKVAAVFPSEAVRHNLSGYPFLTDSRLPTSTLDGIEGIDDLRILLQSGAVDAPAYGSHFLANDDKATGRVIAEQLDLMLRGRLV